MKKLILLLFILLIILNCQKKAKDIKVDGLNTACEFIDAYYITFKDLRDIQRKGDKKISNEQRYKLMKEAEEIQEIQKKLGRRMLALKFSAKDAENCDWDRLISIVEEIKIEDEQINNLKIFEINR